MLTWAELSGTLRANLVRYASQFDRVLSVLRPCACESRERRCDASESLWQRTERQRLLDQLDLSRTLSAAGQRVSEKATRVSADRRLQVGERQPNPRLTGDPDACEISTWLLGPERREMACLLDHLRNDEQRVEADRCGGLVVMVNDSPDITVAVFAVRSREQVLLGSFLRRASRGRVAVAGGPHDDRADPHGGQGGGAGGAGGVAAGDQGAGAGLRAGGGQGRECAAGRCGQADGGEADADRGKRRLGLSGRVPRRVDEVTKSGLLELIEHATDAGWGLHGACRLLELDRVRAYRWLGRRAAGCLDDRQPGGSPVDGLLPAEEAEIIKLFHEWGETGRSHRKLAHRGSYLRRVQVSPSSVRRVRAAHGLRLRRPKRPGSSARKPFPDWVEYRPRQIWIYDTTCFRGRDGRSGDHGPGVAEVDLRGRLRRGDLRPRSSSPSPMRSSARACGSG